ncbi:MAG: hypothetical protein ABI406_14010 [Ktedonobacteraceae bacterium]
MANSLSVWAQSSTPSKLVAGVVVIVGFALLFFIEYIYGDKATLLGSVVFALVSPGMAAIAILFLSIGLTRMRQEHIAWHKEQNFLQGIAYVFLSFSMFMILVEISKLIPPLLAFSLGITFAILGFLCIIQSIRANQVNLRR